MPEDFASAALTVFLLGARHGFDADHLAAIDGLTRLANDQRQRSSRALCGLWFSLGHGCVVITIAVGVNLLVSGWTPPAWIEPLGRWISIILLVSLGMASIRSAVRPSRPESRIASTVRHTLQGFSSFRLSWAVAAVGALFAISFDTIGQAVLFGSTALHRGGMLSACAFGLLFTLGMAITDALNGWWISRLIDRSRAHAAPSSRLFSGVIGSVSVAVGLAGAMQYFMIESGRQLPEWGVLLSVISFGVILSGYAVALSIGHRST